MLATLGVAGVLSRTSSAAGHMQLAAAQSRAMTPGAVLADPPSVAAGSEGNLAVTLEASKTRFELSGQQIWGQSYNGSFTAPTIHAEPGQTVSITLRNRLNVATNLHFHGLHVSPSGDSDNPSLCIPPGATFTYRLAIPVDHPQGTYWYHSHAMSTECPKGDMNGMHGGHATTGMLGMAAPGNSNPAPFTPGDVENQISAGLSGALVIGDTRAGLPEPLQNVDIHTLVFKDIQTDSSGAVVQNTKSTSIDSNAATTRLVNGQLKPVLSMHPGETQFWRLVNAGADIFYKLQLDGYQFTVIAEDGTAYPQSAAAGELLLPPGKRFDVLVTAGPAGTTSLRTLAYSNGPQGDSYPDTALMDLKITGDGVPGTPTPAGFAISGALPDLSDAPLAQHRNIELSEDPSAPNFFINGRQFSMGTPTFDTPAKLGTVEEWTLTNTSGEDHPFHMHSNAFQVNAINGTPELSPHRQDTVIVPHAVNGTPGRVVIRQEFSDYPGTWMFHCHIAAHEDHGMMGYIQVNP
ncbi:multicopper oxidase family protein [Pseudarthrobacter sp. Fe7]|nr:multicopper oxidase family protein [Pseudarthrobacter sp. Fe7]